MCNRLLQLLVTTCSEERQRRIKRYLSYVVIICNFFLGGFEYGVIFPTAMDYLESLGAVEGRATTLFGLLIVSYAAANIVGGYVGGLWADMFIETRPLLVLAALPQIIGNALYFFAVSPVGAIASHALSGLGSGANTAMLAELTRTTSLTHRTSVIGLITFSRQLGIVCGPAVGAYLTDMPDVFRHRVTLLNAPGLLLMFCYLVYMVMLTLFYSNLTVDEDENSSGGGRLRRHAALVPSAAESARTAGALLLPAAAAEMDTPGWSSGRASRQSGGRDGKRQRYDGYYSSDTPETTPKKRPCPASMPGPTPTNTPLHWGKTVTSGAEAAAAGAGAGAETQTPQQMSLVLSLPQPSPSQCSSWPPYRALGPTPEDGEDDADGRAASKPLRSSQSADTPAPSRALEESIVWPHTPDHQPPSCRCPHQEQCPAPGMARPSAAIIVSLSRSSPVSVVREWRELFCWPIVVLLFCNFTAYLTQTSLEALLPALVEQDLRLAIDATGKIFIAGGLVQCLVLVCIFVTPQIPCMRDQRLISIGLLVMVVAHVQLLATICMLRDTAEKGDYGAASWRSPSPPPSPPPRDQRWFWVVLVGSGVQFFGYPLVNSVVTSFMSKMLSRGAQGVGAAGLRLSMCTGLMLGPVWGSGMLRYQLPLLLLPLAVLLCSMLIFCWFERRGAFRERMRQAARVDTVTPRVCAAPRRVRTISALSQIREATRDDVCDDTLGDAGGDSCVIDRHKVLD